MILFLCLVEDGVDPVFYLVGGIDPKWNELYFDIVSHPSYGTYISTSSSPSSLSFFSSFPWKLPGALGEIHRPCWVPTQSIAIKAPFPVESQLKCSINYSRSPLDTLRTHLTTPSIAPFPRCEIRARGGQHELRLFSKRYHVITTPSAPSRRTISTGRSGSTSSALYLEGPNKPSSEQIFLSRSTQPT